MRAARTVTSPSTPRTGLALSADVLVTSCAFEAYIRCPTKSLLYASNETNYGNYYSDWLSAQNEAYRRDGIKLLIGKFRSDEIESDVSDIAHAGACGHRLYVNSVARYEN